MSWSIGYDNNWQRDIGYGVPAICDHPECNKEIDRGLSHVCMNEEPDGGDGCGLHFCSEHLSFSGCERCAAGLPPFEPKPDTPEWIKWKLTDESWAKWRAENPDTVAKLKGI